MRAARTMRETGRERRELANDAGFGGFSVTSVLAGVLVAYGAFAILAGLAAAALDALGDKTDLTTDWERLGTTGGLVVAGLLFLAYLFGGYVAGRMARRSGSTNGFLVFVLSLVIAVGVAGVVNVFTDGADILRNLRSVGIPTSASEWSDVGTVAGIGSLLAMLVGSVMGGAWGERWHTKLLARAIDPAYGVEAARRREADRHRDEVRESEERATEAQLEARHDVDKVTAAARRFDGRTVGTGADTTVSGDEIDARLADGSTARADENGWEDAETHRR